MSEPAVQCPAGYYCLEGTFTLQPDVTFGFVSIGVWGEIDEYDVEAARQALLLKLKATKNPTRSQVITLPLQPQACASGTFCLGGVKTPIMIDWIPSNEEGATAPQKCFAGAYCKPGTPTSGGTGPCFPGHYCPPGSGHPTEAPVGNYARLRGAAVPSLCFPGTWAPLNATITCRVCPAGYTCQSYGTYIPSICPIGTYRSLADSVTCRLCPQGTWAPEYGLTDVSQCEPCPAGRMCGFEGMTNLSFSEVCPDGHVCGEGTNKAMQFSYPCPAGYYCDSETAPEDQFKGLCVKGAYCRRGTKAYLKAYFKCPVGFYCPPGTASAAPQETKCPYMTITAAGAYEITQCYVDEVDICDKVAGRSYMPEFAYQRLDTEEWTTKSSIRFPIVEQTGEVEVLRKILPVKISEAPPMYLNDSIQVYRICPFNISSLGNDYITVIGRNFRDSYTLTCLFRPINDMNWNTINPHSDQLHGHSQTPAVWESKTRVRCRAPATLPDENGTFVGYGVHVSNNGLNYSLTSGFTMPINSTEEYNTTDPYASHLTTNERDEATKRAAAMSTCLIAVVTPLVVDDAYPSDEEGYRQNEDGWFLAPVLSMVSLTFDFTHLPSVMKYNEHWRIAIFVAPSVCEEQKCYEGGGRMRVPSEKIILDPPSPLDMCTATEPRCQKYLVEDGDPNSVTDNPCLGKRLDTCDPKWQQANNKEEGIDFDPLFDLMDNVITNSLDVSPCTRPIPLSQWFESTEIDKHQVINISLLALDDVIIKPEVQILNGMFMSATHYLRNITSVKIQSPDRANRTEGVEASLTATRKLHKSISYEEKEANMEYIWLVQYRRDMGESVSAPYNLPPLYTDFAHGRVLTMFGRTPDAGDMAPVVKDNRFEIEQVLRDGQMYVRPYDGVLPTVTWWGAPTNSPFESLMMTRKYREVWHGLGMNPEGTQPMWDFQQMALPYLPYFSNCDYYDNYIPVWHIFENEEMCELPEIPDPNDHSGENGMPRDWERRAFPPFPHQDDILYLNKLAPILQGIMDATADICTMSFKCRFEENLLQADVNPRWMEADGHELFKISQHPIEASEYLNQAKINRVDRTELPFPAEMDRGNSAPDNVEQYESRILKMGGVHLFDDLINTYGADILLSVPGDSDDGKGDLDYDCTRGCFPREVTFEVRYWQQTPFRKKLINAAVVLNAYDKDATNDEYEFGVDLQPSSWLDLMIAFAFDTTTFLVLFIILSGVSMFIAILFYAVVRGTTRLEVPPRFRFTSMISIIVPPAMIGVGISMAPIGLLMYVVKTVLYGQDIVWAADLHAGESLKRTL